MRDDTPEIETCSLVQDYLLIPRGFSYVILTVFSGLAGVSRLIFPCQMVEGQEIEPLSNLVLMVQRCNQKMCKMWMLDVLY